MRILLHDWGGYAFIIQLSRALAARGHQLEHFYFGGVAAPQGALELQPGDPEGLFISPLTLDEPYRKYEFFRRRFQEREYGRRLAARIEESSCQVVVSANTPLDALEPAVEACSRMRIPFVYWMQDLIGFAVGSFFARKHPLLGSLVGRHYGRMERRLVEASDSVICIADQFRPVLENSGILPERITVLENWAPLDEIVPLPADNAWAREHELVGRKVLLYVGSLGLKHKSDLLLNLADSFADRPDVTVVAISEGPGADRLHRVQQHMRQQPMGKSNLLLLPFQPYERLSEILASATVLFAVVERDASRFSVPSNVLSYLCAARPILLAAPHVSLAARTVAQVAAGITVAPEDVGDLVAEAWALVDDEGRCAQYAANARRYAEQAFEMDDIADRFEACLQGVVESGTPGGRGKWG